MPEVEYANHAEDRLRERGITKADVEWALRHRIGNPDAGEPGTVWIRGYAVGGRIVKVCVRADDHYYVITAVWLS